VLYDIKLFVPGLFRAQGAAQEISPGTTSAVYEILDAAGANQIGWLVEIAGSDVTSTSGYTWYANRSYWFWTSGSAFPSGFRIELYALNAVPTFNPANANQTLTAGPFDTGTTVTPVSSGNWWTIAKNSTGVGYLNMQPGGTQNWYETSPNPYLTITGSDQLIFAGTTSAPTAAMYTVQASPVSNEFLGARTTSPYTVATSR
jgi:hypothetical protein